MEYYNQRLCVTVDELTSCEEGESVISPANYRNLSNRKRLTILRKAGGLGIYALIDYETMPERLKDRFERKYGDPYKLIVREEEKISLNIDPEAREFYANYKSDGCSIPETIQAEYTLNASVLEQVKKSMARIKAQRSMRGNSRISMWDAMGRFIEQTRAQYGHTLPESAARVQAKYREYLKGGYEALISKKLGNKNTTKITEDAARYLIALKRSRVPVYTSRQIFDRYNAEAKENGWKHLESLTTLTRFFNRPEIKQQWVDAVYGELASKQMYQRKHKTILPSLRDALWYGDGTKLNLYYKEYDERGRLIVKTTQVYEVMDSATEVLLGYHISDSENYEAQYYSYRMAIEMARHQPYEIVCDNQGGHKKLTSFFNSICRVFRFTAPYNPQSKTIEAAFGRIQQHVLQTDWRFTGANITAKGARPNIEFIEANKDKLYTLAELKEAYAQARNKWNRSTHPQTGKPRIEMYENSVNEETQSVGMLDMIDMFWIQTDKPSVFTSSGISIQVNKQEHTYEVFDEQGMPDLAFRRKYTGQRFITKYDPMDMRRVRLYIEGPNGLRFVTEAEPYRVIHRALQEQLPGEMEFIRQMDILNKEVRVHKQLEAVELELEHGVAPEQHGLQRPGLKGINKDIFEQTAEKLIKKQPAYNEEIIDVGRLEKQISNLTYDDILSKF